MIGGDTCYGTNDVIVYRYEIAPDLILGPDDVIRKTAELLRLEEPKTIAHETKHLENAKYGNPLFTMKNYSDEIEKIAFGTLGANRITRQCSADNVRSANSIRSSGFHLDGTARQGGVYPDNKLYDNMIWSKLKSEYNK